MTMIPLVHSHERDQLEAELKALFIRLFEENLKAKDDEINVYGMPHLGSADLLAKHFAADGLSVFRNDEDRMRFIYRAWKHRNPERGLHFLRAYLRALFGTGMTEINQLWQLKAGTYPEQLVTDAQFDLGLLDREDYFLTSRVAVDIDADIVPDRIVRALRTAVAARLLLHVRLAKFQKTTMAYAGHLGGAVHCSAVGEA